MGPARLRTLFISAVYPPLWGGTAKKFSRRMSFYPPSQVAVLARRVAGAEAFDRSVPYLVRRLLLATEGVQGWSWLRTVYRLTKAAMPIVVGRGAEIIECARPLPEGVAGYLLAKSLRRKLVINVQGEELSLLRRYRAEAMVMRRVLRGADLVIANSRFTEGMVKEFAGPRVNTGVVWPGLNVDPADWNPDPARVAELRRRLAGEPVLLTLGRLQARKGQDNVVRALPALAGQYPNLRYAVVGSTQGGTPLLRERLLALAQELGVSRHVTIMTDVPDEELPLYYSACDVFVMPNRMEADGDVEGFGQVFLEAGLARKPVIGGNSGGVPDAVVDGQTGLLVDGMSVPDIAAALLRLLGDSALAQRMAEAGRERALRMRDRDSFEVYEHLLETICPACRTAEGRRPDAAFIDPVERELGTTPAGPAVGVDRSAPGVGGGPSWQ
jgi:phosphatidylinositol alpha-1,6-mannosyltransferase